MASEEAGELVMVNFFCAFLSMWCPITFIFNIHLVAWTILWFPTWIVLMNRFWGEFSMNVLQWLGRILQHHLVMTVNIVILYSVKVPKSQLFWDPVIQNLCFYYALSRTTHWVIRSKFRCVLMLGNCDKTAFNHLHSWLRVATHSIQEPVDYKCYY